MRFDARSTRGGPLSVRVTFVLLLVSAVVVAGLDAHGRNQASLEEANTVVEQTAIEAELAPVYETASLAPSLADLEAELLDSEEPSEIEVGAPADTIAVLAGEFATGEAPDLTPDEMHEVVSDHGADNRHNEDFDTYFEDYADLEPESEPHLGVIEGELERGQTLSSMLGDSGVRPSIIHVIASELSPVFNFRRAKPGQEYRLVLDDDGQVLTFDYRINQDESVHLMRDASGMYRARKDINELVPHVVRMAGVVDTSLYEAIRDLGEDPSLASTFANVFAWQVDLDRAVQEGDEFNVLYERMYRTGEDGRGEYVRPGRILAARYRSGEKEYEALHFEPEDGRGGYYRPDGTSIERQFLTAPLDYSRITSGYSNARRHPILKVTRAHHGIDYAAPRGAPVWAVADGTVVHRGRNGGFGRLVKVRHAGGYVSYYSHLSGYAANLHVGQKVSQKQVVGYVGSSGLATGPHTCFRIAKDGRYLNPFKIESPAASPITGESRALFAQRREELLIGLDGGTSLAVQDAL